MPFDLANNGAPHFVVLSKKKKNQLSSSDVYFEPHCMSLIWLSQEKSAKDAHRFDRSHVFYTMIKGE
jgi:hypothetical protein